LLKKINVSLKYCRDCFLFILLVPSNVKPSDIIISIREFIRNFYLCEECVTHFINMTSNAENEINSYHESVLYLWRGKINILYSLKDLLCFLGHNIVNKRLRYQEYSTDPNWPKVPFPTKQQCNSCVQQIDENGDTLEYDENEIYKFLKGFYYLQNSATNHRDNFLLLFFILIIDVLIFNK